MINSLAMAARRKFGAFSGVFTPSILTILGVIMFLRLPQVVGQAGMWAAIGIVVAAHVISVTTGLSVSSIATDKRVKAGGSYYIISRSLGLPIGGTLGLALFVGLSFSVSLYIIGFAESFLTYWNIGIDPATGKPDIDSIRIAGSVALTVVTVVTFISTSLAIKTQYFIMAAIVLSLASILIGNPDAPAATAGHLEPLAGGASLAVLFGLFFPAVTGFEAGVSMSGDLKDPKRDIPRGTLIAIAVGFVVYIGEVVFFAFTIPADQLATNPRVLLDYSFYAPLVVAGIWGATISSAFGSILGAPRILQAIAMDHIAPRFFAKGSGTDNEPRNAVLLAFVIAEGGILIGSLDAIAGIVTMFFMVSYGVLNLSCAVESWASPDFRPDFKIPRLVSLIGAATAFVLMVLLDLPAMLGALAAMGLVFVWLKRKELALEGGDTWTGIWASIARKALDRLSRQSIHHRNWRPNVLFFSSGRTARATRGLVRSLVAHNGVMSEFELGAADAAGRPAASTHREGPDPAEDDAAAARPEGVFRRHLTTVDPWETILGVARYHGIAGYEPNTAVIDWDLVNGSPDRTAALVVELEAIGRHAVFSLHRAAPPSDGPAHLDFWWRGDGRNLALGLALVRFLTIAGDWVQVTPRFIATVADPGQKRTIERRLAAWLADARVNSEVRVLDAPAAPDTFESLVARVSGRASLVIVGLTRGDATDGSALAAAVQRLEALQRPALLVRAAPSFVNPFPHVDLEAKVARAAPAAGSGVRLERPATLQLAGDDALSRHVVAYHDGLADALRGWGIDGPTALVQPFSHTLDEVARLARRTLAQLDRAAAIPQASRRRRTLFRIERGLLRGVEEELRAFAQTFGDPQRDTLRAALAVLSDRLGAIESGLSEVVLVSPGDGDAPARSVPADPEPGGRDEIRARRANAKGVVRWPLRRHVAALHASDGRQAIVESLVRLRDRREQLVGALDALVSWVLSEVRREAARLGADAAEGEETASAEGADASAPGANAIDAALDERIAACRDAITATLEGQRQAGRSFARDAAQKLGVALVDPVKTRRVRGGHGDEGPLDVEALVEDVAPSFALQHHHVARAELDVALRGMHRDLEAMAEQVRADLVQRIARRVLANLDAFLGELGELAARLREEPGAPANLGAREDVAFDDQAVLQRMTDVIERDTEALPESVETLSEASFQALSEGRLEDLEEVTIAVRRLVAFVLKTDLLGALRESLAGLAAATTRAANAVRDVARLVSFAGGERTNEADLEELGDERAEIIAAGAERVATERAHVERAWHQTEDLLGELLTQVAERTRIAAIGQSAGKLDRFIRTHERRGLGAWLRGAGGRVRDGVRRGMVDLSYRWSRGVLLARRLRATADEPASAVERVIALHRASAPSPAVWEALPIFYRQVFLGRAAADPAYWMPASEELTAAERAVDTHQLGHPGALWITGPSGSGVGAVTRRITQERFGPERTFVVRPVEHGSIDPAQFEAAVCQAVGRSGDVDEALGTLPEGSAVVIEELELWWERSPGGLAVVERLGSLVDRYGARILFVVGVNVHVMRLLRRLEALVDQVLATVHCHPLEAMRLKDAVLRRHDATGLGLRLEGESRERGPSDWKTARLFTGLFDYSDGYVGAALHAWIAHIVEVTPDFVVVRRPRPESLDALDSLDPEWSALLVELVLHRKMDRARLLRVTGLPSERLDAALAGLRRAGLVVGGRDDEAVAVERFVQRHVERWLVSREVL